MMADVGRGQAIAAPIGADVRCMIVGGATGWIDHGAAKRLGGNGQRNAKRGIAFIDGQYLDPVVTVVRSPRLTRRCGRRSSFTACDTGGRGGAGGGVGAVKRLAIKVSLRVGGWDVRDKNKKPAAVFRGGWVETESWPHEFLYSSNFSSCQRYFFLKDPIIIPSLWAKFPSPKIEPGIRRGYSQNFQAGSAGGAGKVTVGFGQA